MRSGRWRSTNDVTIIDILTLHFVHRSNVLSSPSCNAERSLDGGLIGILYSYTLTTTASFANVQKRNIMASEEHVTVLRFESLYSLDFHHITVSPTGSLISFCMF